MLSRRGHQLDPAERTALAAVVASSRYELVPGATSRAAAEQIPPGITVTITASPKRGLEPTVDLAVDLAARGRRVVPHIAARLVEDREHLSRVLQRLTESGIDELFVVGGDGEPQGEFHDGVGLLEAIEAEGAHGLTFGIPAYPEGHPGIPDSELARAFEAKRRFASYLTTQMCFDPSGLSRWLDGIRSRGIDLPVLLGVPGVVAVTRLLSVGSRIGVGASLRFLARHRGLWKRLLSPRYSPEELLLPLAPTIANPSAGVAGLHIYTFNQVEATRRWQDELLGDLRR